MGAILLLVRLRKKLGKIGLKASAGEFVKMIIGTLAACLVCLLLDRLVPQAQGALLIFLRLALCAGLPLAVYLGFESGAGAKTPWRRYH